METTANLRDEPFTWGEAAYILPIMCLEVLSAALPPDQFEAAMDRLTGSLQETARTLPPGRAKNIASLLVEEMLGMEYAMLAARDDPSP